MIDLTLLTLTPFIDRPYHLLGWLGWFVMGAVLLWFLQKSRFDSKIHRFWLIFSLLALGAVITALVLGLHLPWDKTIPLPNLPRENATPLVVIFAALPLFLAAGLLGSWPAAIIGLISGVVLSIWNTHSIFTPIESAAIGYLLSLALRQNYRTLFYKFLRHPLGAAVAMAIFSAPLFLASAFFNTSGSLAVRLDYCFTQSWVLMVTNAIQLLIAGLVCELFSLQKSTLWVQFKSFQPAPGESGLQTRVLSTTIPMMIALLLTLSIADWAVAGEAARTMLKNQLKSAADTAAENIPYVTETGQSLVADIVSTGVPVEDADRARSFLQEKLRSIPYFRQLYVFDLTGTPLAGYPINSADQLFLSAEEQAGIALALNGVEIQSYTILPSGDNGSLVISFLAAIPDEYGLAKGVLLARTDLTENLFSQPTIQALTQVSQMGGEGLILDADNQILFDSGEAKAVTTYSGTVPQEESFFDEVSGTGTRRMVFVEPINEKGWVILLSVPASIAQEMALNIAIPLLALSLLITTVISLWMRYLMRTVTFSLKQLATQAARISQGDLEIPVESKGVDEVGRLGTAFEQMRVRLKDRLEELDRLVEVSKGVSANLSIEGASPFILSAAMAYGASSARLVLFRDPDLGIESELDVYADGPQANEFAPMDKPLLELMKEETKVMVIPSRTRLKRMGIAKGNNIPAEMLGAPLREDQSYLGILWVGYSEPHRFLEGETRFFTTLSNQALLAVTNSNLYLSAELGKRRLESVLASSPDPVLLVDSEGMLLTANQAAEEVAGLLALGKDTLFGEKRVVSEGLKSVLEIPLVKGKLAKEVVLENGRTYLASLSPVEVDEKRAGKVCVLHDVTEYKALEQQKSEFVAAVSRDLRTPISQLSGFVSMLPMVGELNSQQKEISEKINKNLDKMGQMVSDLLNLERFEAGLELNLEKFSPMELLDQVITQLQAQATQRKVQLMKELSVYQEAPIEADRVEIQQALVSLLENAIKYSPLNGVVHLRIDSDEENITFVVQDHGQGIAPLDLPYVFEKAKKPARKDDKDAGYGLVIVKTIAERHHGKVWVESKLGKGSTFYLEIPMLQDKNKRQK